jgi:sulfite reductase beta subunit-like hemoprotein
MDVVAEMSIDSADIERFVGRYSIGRDGNPLNITGSPHFLRFKVPGGFITSQQFQSVAELAKKYSRGKAEITNRQDIQLHWIRAEDSLDIFTVMDEIGFTTDMCGQGFGGARYGDARNIVCCPASGIEEEEILDGSSLMRDLTNFLVGNPDFQDMPRKFKFSISGCGCDCTRAVTNDLAFVAVKKGEEAGFTILVGGSTGSSLPGPRLAQNTGVFVRQEDAFDFAITSIEIHRDYGNRESKTKARFKWLLQEWGLEKIIKRIEENLEKSLERYSGPIFLRNMEHEGVKQQSQAGCYYVNIPLAGGRLSSNQMAHIAGLSKEYGNGELRLTPQQNIILPNVKEIEEVLKRIEAIGFSLSGSKTRWNSMGCSSDFCGKSQSPHAKEITSDILGYLETRFDRSMLDEAGFRIHVSGCPHNCCANLIAEIGLAGKLIKEGNERKQFYDILLGGGTGREPQFGRLVERKVPARKVKYKIAALLSNYAKHRDPSERLKEFCSRHTVAEMRVSLQLRRIG